MQKREARQSEWAQRTQAEDRGPGSCFVQRLAAEFDKNFPRGFLAELIDRGWQNAQRAFVERAHSIVLQRLRGSAQLLGVPL